MSEDSIIGFEEEPDYTPDASGPPARELSDEERLEKMREENDEAILKKARLYYLVFTSPDGKAVLDDMVVAYQNRVSLDETNPDPYLTAFCEGQRSVVLQIQALSKVGEGV